MGQNVLETNDLDWQWVGFFSKEPDNKVFIINILGSVDQEVKIKKWRRLT